MTPFLESASRVADRLAAVFSIGFLIALLLLISAQVVARYLFHAPPGWLEELARYCMVWSGLLGASCAYRRGMDPALAQPPAWVRRALPRIAGMLRPLVALVFTSVLLLTSIGFLQRHGYLVTDLLRVNSALVVAIVPITAALISLHALAELSAAGRAEPAGRDVQE